MSKPRKIGIFGRTFTLWVAKPLPTTHSATYCAFAFTTQEKDAAIFTSRCTIAEARVRLAYLGVDTFTTIDLTKKNK